FTLNFYGASYNNLIVSTNGNAHLFDGGNDYLNVCLPDPTYAFALGIIAPFWDDFNLRQGGDVYSSVVGSAPNRIFVLEWRDVPFYDDASNSVTFEALIYESSGGPNEIRFQYLDLNG